MGKIIFPKESWVSAQDWIGFSKTKQVNKKSPVSNIGITEALAACLPRPLPPDLPKAQQQEGLVPVPRALLNPPESLNIHLQNACLSSGCLPGHTASSKFSRVTGPSSHCPLDTPNGAALCPPPLFHFPLTLS